MNLGILLHVDSNEPSVKDILNTFKEDYVNYFQEISYENLKIFLDKFHFVKMVVNFILNNLKENYETFDDFRKFVLFASSTQNTVFVVEKYKLNYPNFIETTRNILSENHEWILRKMPIVGYHRNNVRMFFCKIYQTLESFKLFLEICDSPIMVVDIFGSDYIEKIRNDREFWKILLSYGRNKKEILEIKKQYNIDA